MSKTDDMRKARETTFRIQTMSGQAPLASQPKGPLWHDEADATPPILRADHVERVDDHTVRIDDPPDPDDEPHGGLDRETFETPGNFITPKKTHIMKTVGADLPVTVDATTETVMRSVTRKHRKPKPVGTQHLGVRCSPDELERWQARADSEGRSLGNWVRRMLNNV